MAWFLAPLLAAHDRRAIEIFSGYADVAQPDALTARFQSLADHWRSSVALSDEALGAQIRADGIDVLVDLAGHAGDNRLAMFARRPAPVQVNWLGYLNTTGLTAMDYRLVDDITDPPGEADAFATETLVRLADGWACFEPMEGAPEPGPPPSVDPGAVTFCAFSSPAKLGERVLDAWSEILNRTPGSRLLIKGASFDDEGARSQLLSRFTARGVSADRLRLVSWIPSTAEHLALYNSVDICLDTFPHNGVTTTCEALWMGLPVVALRGERHCARISASFLTRLGLGGPDRRGSRRVCGAGECELALGPGATGRAQGDAEASHGRPRRSATPSVSRPRWRRPTGPCGGAGAPTATRQPASRS